MIIDRTHTATAGQCPNLLRVVRGEALGDCVAIDAQLVLGSGDLVLRSSDSKPRQCTVTRDGGVVFVRDNGTGAQTKLDGRALEPGQITIAKSGSMLEVGGVALLFVRHVNVPTRAGTWIEVDDGSSVRRHELVSSLSVGRDRGLVDIVVADRRVSAEHAELRVDGDDIVFEDLGSTNGSRVDGQPVRGETVPLHVGAVVQLAGSTTLTFSSNAAEAPSRCVIDVATEGEPSSERVVVDPGVGASIAEVAMDIGRLLGYRGEGPCVMYRISDGFHPSASTQWSACGARSGESWRVGIAIESEDDLPVEWQNDVPSSTTVVPRPPRHVAKAPATLVQLPRPPQRQERAGKWWGMVGGLGGVAAALALVVVRQDATSRVFAALIGVTGVLGILASTMGERARRRSADRRFEQGLAEAEAQFAAGADRQRADLHTAWPDPKSVSRCGRAREDLWLTRPEHEDCLELRVGVGSAPIAATWDTVRGDDDPQAIARLDRLVEQWGTVTDVPLTLQLQERGVAAIVGSRSESVARWLVMQAMVRHSPEDLGVAIIADRPVWRWAAWAPHSSHDGVLMVAESQASLAVVLEQAEAAAAAEDGRRWIAVVHGNGARFDEAARKLSSAGWSIVQLVSSVADCVVDPYALIDTDEPRIVASGANAELSGLDEATERSAEAVARALASCRDPRRSAADDRISVSGPTLFGITDPDAFDAWMRWSDDTGPPSVVGVLDNGSPLTIDLASDKSALIAGAPGSGKSEFIKTLLVSLALTHSPDALNLFLMDFKGGATFRELRHLPHVVGVVTDLESDRNLTARAFTALDAEVARRKRRLEAAGASDLDEHNRLASSGQHLPMLAVLIDEFAQLRRTNSDLVARLDTIAAQGRSLGIYLLLSSQDPLGAVTEDVRTNTLIRIAFRLNEEAPSLEMLRSPLAARIPTNRPGRGFIRRGGGNDIAGFQSGFIGGITESRALTAARWFEPWRQQDESPVEHGRLPTDAGRLCTTLLESWRLSRKDDSTQLWYPPLPEAIDADEIDWPKRPKDSLAFLLGCGDQPELPAQYPVGVDLSTVGHLAVLGSFRSGKSTLLRQAIIDVATQHDPHALHVYCVDGGVGSLGDLSGLPHVGAVIAADDGELLGKLLRRLTKSLDDRRAGMANLSRDHPWILVAIDDFGLLRAQLDAVGADQTHRDLLDRILQLGPAMRIHVIATMSEPSDMHRDLFSKFAGRIMLRMQDRADYSLVDRVFREQPEWPAGRCVARGSDATEIQVVRPSDHSAVRRGDGPAQIRRLPTAIDLRDVGRANAATPTFLLGGDDVEPIGVSPERDFLILGPPRSGRTSALRSYVDELRRVSPDTRFAEIVHTAGQRICPDARLIGDSSELGTLVTSLDADLCLVADDLDRSAADLLEAVGSHRKASMKFHLVAAAASESAIRSYEALFRDLIEERHALLLQPGADVELAFGLRPRRPTPSWPVGRGLLVDGATATIVHVALS